MLKKIVEKDAAVPVDEAQPATDGMRGHQLLGTFASGSQEGVILKSKDGSRRRLLIGDLVEGWALETVDARSVVFRDRSGELVQLDLIMAKLPEVRSVVVSDTSQASDVNDKAVAENTRPPEPQRVIPTTFEEIWDNRRAAAEASKMPKKKRPPAAN